MRSRAGESIMKRALYIGVFDPINLGHLDIIERAGRLVDELVIGVLANPQISTDIPVTERIRIVKKAVNHIENVEVIQFQGAMMDFIKTHDINLCVRGLRMMSDFEYELNIVQVYSQLEDGLDTVFLTTNEIYANYSSREVRQIAKNHGNIEKFLPACIINDVKSIYV